jgi:hypothetical protein
MNTKRPFLLYMLVLVFLLSALTSALGVFETVKTWNWLRAFEVYPSTIYLVYKNTFLTLGWIVAALSLWLRFSWAPLYGGTLTILSTLWFWLDRVILTQNPLPFNRHLLLILLSFLFLALILFSLYLLVPFMRMKPGTKEDQTHLIPPPGGSNEETSS